jgi:hypothetical protein
MNVLFFGLNWVGDVVMSYGAIANAAIGAGRPVDVVTRPHLAPLYHVHPGVGKVWAVDTKAPFWRSLPTILRWRRTGTMSSSSCRARFEPLGWPSSREGRCASATPARDVPRC